MFGNTGEDCKAQIAVQGCCSVCVEAHAELRGDDAAIGSFNAKEKDQVVHSVLEMLEIRHIQHSVIGDASKRGISGGQKKRVSIGLELTAAPPGIGRAVPGLQSASESAASRTPILRTVARAPCSPCDGSTASIHR